MSETVYLALLIFAVAGLLFLALKTGFIGGVGSGSYRSEQPLPYWLGIAVTAFMLFGLVAALVLTIIRSA